MVGLDGVERPALAATQDSVAEKTSTVATLDDADFEKQIQTPIPDDDTLEQAFPNKELREVVAYDLEAKPTDNLKEAVKRFRNEDVFDRYFIISPDSNSKARVTEPILNWTGISALKNLFGIISVEDQPDFDQKAAKLVQCIGSVPGDLYVELPNDDLTTKGFNELADLGKFGIEYDYLDVSQNQITDFSAIDKLASSGENLTVRGLPERGVAQDKSALSVNDSSVVIKGGVPGTTFLPKTLTIDPLKENPSKNIGIFRLETPAQTASFESFSDSQFPKVESVGVLKHPITLGKIDAVNQIDFNNHEWHYIFPWYRALSQVTELVPGDFDPVTTNFDQFKHMDIQGIPADESSVRVRTLWANGGSISETGSPYLNSPYTTLVNIPLTHDSSASSSAATTTSAQSTSSSQASSITPGRGLAVKGEAVCALKKIGLYRQPTFTTHARRYFYPRQSQIHRPQFVVMGYGHSKQGRLRYRVRDVNHASTTFGRQGYITALPAYVAKTYYQSRPRRIKVINPSGVNAYRRLNLTDQVKHYRRGQVLRIAAIKHYHLTTRVKLTNGQYVTANKTLIKRIH